MAQIPESTADLAAVLEQPVDLNFELPDPDDEEILEYDFQQLVDNAWRVCDRFDLQTEIWRGRILRVVRDREKKGGDGRGTGFLNWLKSRDISKSQAYSLIELANSADTLLAEGKLSPDAIRNFSKRAFVETAKSSPEVQQLVTEMEKLPESHLKPLQQEVAASPDVDTVKQVTSDARFLAKYLDAAAQVQAIEQSSVDMEIALEEALRLDCLNTAADLVKQASTLEQTVGKLYTTWKRLGSLSDRLYVDTGASTPHLRSLLNCIDRLAGEVIEVPLDDTGEQIIRLKVMTDSNS